MGRGSSPYKGINPSLICNDAAAMPQLRIREIDLFDTMMDDFIEGMKALTSSLGVRLLDCMKVKSMADVGDIWKNLDVVSFESFYHNDSYCVPIWRRISPDWLQWRKKKRLRNPLLNTQQNEMLLQKYSLFLPYLATLPTL